MTDATGRSVSVRIARHRARRRRHVRGVRPHHHLPRLPAGLRRGRRRPRSRRRRPRERRCPRWPRATRLPAPELEAKGHATQPPARYTEASLVKRLEELGIGRPSTYASIIQTIQDREYVWKKGTALVPTLTAFAVVNAAGAALPRAGRLRLHRPHGGRPRRDRRRPPRARCRGCASSTSAPRHDGAPDSRHVGLKELVDTAPERIDAAAVNAIPIGIDPDGQDIVVKPGRYGPYLKRGDDTASVPTTWRPTSSPSTRPSSCSRRPRATWSSARTRPPA